MSKQIYIVAIEDGPETHWQSDEADREKRYQQTLQAMVTAQTTGKIPAVTVKAFEVILSEDEIRAAHAKIYAGSICRCGCEICQKGK
jgi:hypothetical protein